MSMTSVAVKDRNTLRWVYLVPSCKEQDSLPPTLISEAQATHLQSSHFKFLLTYSYCILAQVDVYYGLKRVRALNSLFVIEILKAQGIS